MSDVKRRGAGQPPRTYTRWEWTKGYAAWLLVLPLYLGLWAFARVFKRVPRWLHRKLLREWFRETESRPMDVRIPGDGMVPAYMNRWWRIRRNAFFNCYFHLVRRSDDDTALHDHPWWNFSIVLSGGYTEHRIMAGGVHTKRWYGPRSVLFRRSGNYAHRLELDRMSDADLDGHDASIAGHPEIPAKTIFVTGPTLRRWGFHHTERWVDAYDWDDFCDSRGISTNKMSGYAAQVSKDRIQ